VSVVLPFFNAARFLRETLDSVFAQTFSDWELLLIDDGSTDASTEIAHHAVERAPDRVFYLEHDNHSHAGLAASRNLGASRVCGEWIAMLDADDVWLPQKVARQIAVADEHPRARVIFGRPQYWRSWNDGEDVDVVPEFSKLCGRYEPPDLLLATVLGEVTPPPPSDVLIARDLWDEIGGCEPNVPDLYEDQAVLAKCLAVAPAVVAPETLTRYRRHEASLEAQVTADADTAYAQRIEFLRWLENTFKDHADPTVRRAIARLTWPVRNAALHRAVWRTKRTLAGVFVSSMNR
jgi:glycosyltransferase involved in cell wall biosynthesis